MIATDGGAGALVRDRPAPVAPEAALRGALALAAGGDIEGALDALDVLRARHPGWAEPPLRLADMHRAAGRLDLARTCYAAALRCEPDRHSAMLALGAMDVAAGRVAEAEPLLRRCCALAPDDAASFHTLGLALMLHGQTMEARDVLARAHALDPGNALCAVHLADAATARDDGAAQLDRFEQASRADPWNIGILTGRAAMLAHLQRPREALDVLEAATLLQPDAAVPIAMYADMLARTTRQADAEIALRRAILLDPGNDDAVMALSVVLMRLHRHAESLALLQGLLAREVEPAGPLCNMATVLVALGRQAEAVACAREAIVAAPHHAAPRRALCNALPYLSGITGAALLAAARDCADRQPRGESVVFGNDPDPARRLKIGLLSGTLRIHPVGWLTIAGFENLDPDRYELVCFSPDKSADPIGRRFAKVASGWEDSVAHDDRQLAERIRALSVDILIDLGGYGDLGRMQVCSHRAAPVQIKWVGMQNHSTGLAEMDWFVTDRWETSDADALLYSEKLLRLRDGYVCYAPPDDAPDVACPARDVITYGCYNNLAKITPDVIAAWARVLHGVAGARLVLKTHQFNDADTCRTLHLAFAAHGVARERIELRGSSPHRELLRQYGDIDVVLDPFPYSGGLTTCEALWMGVPTLTMPGDTFASRHSASHMSNVGLGDWIVGDVDAYVARAIELAAARPWLAELRAGLRERVRRSPLCDAPRFGASLDQALRRAWGEWCAARPRPDVYQAL